jgi:hypothetical protein
MYRGRPWTMRQYAGFSTARETNRRVCYMLERGLAGINIAFDLPTQHGYDSDHPLARGEVGIPISALRDMRKDGEACTFSVVFVPKFPFGDEDEVWLSPISVACTAKLRVGDRASKERSAVGTDVHLSRFATSFLLAHRPACLAKHGAVRSCREGHEICDRAIAGKLSMRPLVAPCDLGLGKLYRRTGERERAQEHLGTATAMYLEMDMRFWREQAEAEMKAMG